MIIPFKKEHAYNILERNVREQDIWLSLYGDFEAFVNIWEKGGPGYTVVVNDDIIGCGGIIKIDWRRGEAWTLLSSLFFKYKKTCVSAIVKKLDEIIISEKLRRVQALVFPGDIKSERFIEFVGFQKEGLLRSFGPNGEDLVMFGKVI